MACAAIVALHVVGGPDPGFTCRHGETDVHMTYPAGILCPVRPVLEKHWGKAGLGGIVVDGYVAVFMERHPFFLYSSLGKGNSCANDHRQSQAKTYPFHKPPYLIEMELEYF
jgi:hypothetical protein